MGIFDKAKDLAGKTDDAAKMAKEHADKVPGDMGDTVSDMADKVDELTDKIPGADSDE
jgi:uncharacterized protein YjbJ (UPF0337 family)